LLKTYLKRGFRPGFKQVFDKEANEPSVTANITLPIFALIQTG